MFASGRILAAVALRVVTAGDGVGLLASVDDATVLVQRGLSAPCQIPASGATPEQPCADTGMVAGELVGPVAYQPTIGGKPTGGARPQPVAVDPGTVPVPVALGSQEAAQPVQQMVLTPADPATVAKSTAPQPMCTDIGLNVGADDLANQAFWQAKCQDIPGDTEFVLVKMGATWDYFKPLPAKSWCDMFATDNSHLWSSNGANWQAPSYKSTDGDLGGSGEDWPSNTVAGDHRRQLSFWGSVTERGGCCAISYANAVGEPSGWNQPFEVRSCKLPDPELVKQAAVEVTDRASCAETDCYDGYELMSSPPEKCSGAFCKNEECCQLAPVDCAWGAWSHWGSCTLSCGEGGTQTSTRGIQEQAANEGQACEGEASREQACNTDVACPVDCAWGEWETWSACSLTCGGGQMTRMRSPSVLPLNNGLACSGDEQEESSCADFVCPSLISQLKREGTPCAEEQVKVVCEGGCCTSPPGWTSVGGTDCSLYAMFNLCTTSGEYGSGWKDDFGLFEQWANAGISNLQACCECGGGVQNGELINKSEADLHSFAAK